MSPNPISFSKQENNQPHKTNTSPTTLSNLYLYSLSLLVRLVSNPLLSLSLISRRRTTISNPLLRRIIPPLEAQTFRPNSCFCRSWFLSTCRCLSLVRMWQREERPCWVRLNRGVGDGQMGSSSQGSRAQTLVRVRRDLLASCMTCPLCHKLFRDATTVSECLHTCQFRFSLIISPKFSFFQGFLFTFFGRESVIWLGSWVGLVSSRSGFVFVVSGRGIIVILEFFWYYSCYFASFSFDSILSCRRRVLLLSLYDNLILCQGLIGNLSSKLLFFILGVTVASLVRKIGTLFGEI